MRYCSTRGGDAGTPFENVLFSAYASDGGLYVPESIPMLKASDMRAMEHATLTQVTGLVLSLFTDVLREECDRIASRAFASFNGGQDLPVPLRKMDAVRPGKTTYFLDAGCGPTLAFKDIGQQVVLQLMSHFLKKSSRKANILVETTGDTGPAAVAAAKGIDNINVVCLYPHMRVSPVQELQLITVDEPNVRVFRTEVVDSDEQTYACKILFQDPAFSKEFSLCSVNSINFARVLAQSCYYVWAYIKLMPRVNGIVNFVVPSGAFGNACSGYLAKLMGVPIGKIVCATNANDFVHRTIAEGDMRIESSVSTDSPAMDIQLAYNLERMIYFQTNMNHNIVRDIMLQVESPTRAARLDDLLVMRIHETFSSVRVSDADTLGEIKRVVDLGFHLCPHSAIGVHASRSPNVGLDVSHPVVCVLTANFAKFEDTLRKANVDPPAHSGIEALKRRNATHFAWLRAERHTTTDQKIQSWAARLRECIREMNSR